jgi:Putative zincin peptidase
LKYIKNIPSTDYLICENLLSNGWKKLKEPKDVKAAILYSLPIMIISFFIELILIFFLYQPFKDIIKRDSELKLELTLNLNIFVYLVAIIIFLFIHELIHAIYVPNMLKSNKTYWGFNGMFAFVYTEEKIKKSRFIIISLMPYITLSFILPMILSIFGILNGFICLLCLLNAGGSCVDLLNIILISFQVPDGGYIISNGHNTYYKH